MTGRGRQANRARGRGSWPDRGAARSRGYFHGRAHSNSNPNCGLKKRNEDHEQREQPNLRRFRVMHRFAPPI